MATLQLTPSAVEPGQRVEFEGSYYHDGTPVILRWDSVDGPEVATVSPAEMIDFSHGYWRSISGNFTVPADAPPGAHVVVATQEETPGRPTWGVPSRAVVQVGGAGPPTEKSPADESPARISTIEITTVGDADLVPVLTVGLVSAVLAGVGAALAGRIRAARRGVPASP